MQGKNRPCLFHKRIFIERRIATYVLQYSSHCKTCPSQLCEICAYQKEISFNSPFELFRDTPAGFIIQFLRGRAELREMPRSFSIKFYSETQVSSRLGMSGGRSPRHAQNPLSGERRTEFALVLEILESP